jgi:hypothetical protein
MCWILWAAMKKIKNARFEVLAAVFANVSSNFECYAVLQTFQQTVVLCRHGQEVPGLSSFIKGRKFVDKLSNCSFSRTLFHGIVRIKMKNGK